MAFRSRLREDRIGLEVQVVDVPLLRTRPRVLARILFNLLDNAVKYRRREGAEIRLVARHTGEWVEIEVRDNGPTIPADRREWVFQPGTRLAKEGPGSGIGLALSSNLARTLHAELRYEAISATGSDPGGNVFVLRVPAPSGGPSRE